MLSLFSAFQTLDVDEAGFAGWLQFLNGRVEMLTLLIFYGRLGGAMSLTSGYARNPLVITGPDGKQKLTVVSEEAFVDFGAAITHDRFRGYIDFPVPLLLSGRSGTRGQYQFTAASVSLGSNPDTVSAPRIGIDMRRLDNPEACFS